MGHLKPTMNQIKPFSHFDVMVSCPWLQKSIMHMVTYVLQKWCHFWKNQLYSEWRNFQPIKMVILLTSM